MEGLEHHQRAERDRALLVHVGALYWAGTQFVLRVAPIPWDAWWRIILLGATVLGVVELDKLIRRWLSARRTDQPGRRAQPA